ncbi:MAG TPA: sugar ABC transporter permease [Trueperaceae bacterium]
MFESRLLLALIVVVGVPLATIAYVWLVERLVGLLPDRTRDGIRPWLWVAPGILLLTGYLVYPTLNTLYLSFLDANSTEFVGLANYRHIFTDDSFITSLRNNALWLVFLTAFTVGFGLLFAILFDKVPYEAAAKALIFLPMAISFVAAGVIWKLMYDFQPPGRPQTGTLNAITTSLGGDPVAWLLNQPWNNFFLIIVGVWVWTGFALVILSAGLKGIPAEIIEAARVDGATEWQTLTRVTIPMMGSTIAVVATTMIIFALKAFDIVYVMTSGNFGTDVIANRMYEEMFNINHFGRAGAIAVILLLAIVPIMFFNIRRFREQEAMR